MNNHEVGSLQEKLLVKDMMTCQVVTVPHDLTMEQVKALLGDMAITGAPVVDDKGRICGIVSMFDVLKALEENLLSLPVAGRMSTPVIVTTPDSTVAEAIALFRQHRFNRLPVVDGERVVGMLTPGDIVRKLANVLKLDLVEEAAGPQENRTILQWAEEFPVAAGEFGQAGEVSIAIKKKLQEAGLSPLVIKKAVIAAYEAEMNMVIHSHGGAFEVRMTPEGVLMTARDQGPGIEDVAKAMEEGFSTAPQNIRRMGFGAGMGLPNIKRSVDSLEITSRIGQGTEVKMVIHFQDGGLNENKTDHQ
ncbi:MAG: CBS domain-containing protein [Clostridia bacterium]|nr:CBS domain-containing protein [Clostridia bacterium]